MNRLKYIFIFSLFFQVSYSQTYSWNYVGDIADTSIQYGFHFFIDSIDNFITFRKPNPPYPIYRSTDEGKTWTTISSINVISLSGWELSCDTIGSGIKITNLYTFRTVGGTTIILNLPSPYFFSNLQDFVRSQYLNRSTVVGDSGKIFTSGFLGLMYSNDSGYTWYSTDIYGERNNTMAEIIYDFTTGIYYNWQVASVVVDSFKNIIASSRVRGIFYSTNNGNCWIQQNTGLTDTSVYSLDIDSHNNIYAVTSTKKIFKGIASIIPVPVELTAFSVSMKNEIVTLKWQTATEINNAKFEVERISIDTDQRWKNIGFVNGAGTSNSPNHYSFVDDAELEGSYRYRLKQIDRDGQFKYSQEVVVNIIPGKFLLFQNYPNPFNPSTTIKFSIPTAEFVSLKVFDVLGKEVASLINEILPAGTITKEYSFKNLPSGMYVYQLNAGKFTDKKRMLLLK